MAKVGVASIGEMPAHTHERGTMNITATVINRAKDWNLNRCLTVKSGAFYVSNANNKIKTNYTNADAASGGNYTGDEEISFDASRSWTGETSSVGDNDAHSLMQPFLSVFMWRRTN